MNIIKHELRSHFKSTLIWAIALVIFVLMTMMKFDATSQASNSMAAIIEGMPQVFKAMIGVNYFDINTSIGFFAATFLYIAILGGIHGGMLGAGLLTKEETNKTSEFLLVKPISRNKIVGYKIITGLILVTIISLVTLLSSFIAVGSFSPTYTEYFGDVAILNLGYCLIEIIFLAVGFLLSTIVRKAKLVSIFISLILFVTFFLTIFSELYKETDFLKYFTPFSWFNPKYLLGSVEFNPVFIILGILSIVIPLALTFVFYRKKDMDI